MDRGASWATVHGVAELDMTEVTEHAARMQHAQTLLWKTSIPIFVLCSKFILDSNLKKKILYVPCSESDFFFPELLSMD